MTDSKRKILVISHDVTQTGAPLLLLHLLSLLKENGVRLNILVRNKSGQLAGAFKELSQTFGFMPRIFNHTLKSRIKYILLGKYEPFDIQSYTKDIDVVLNNTITNGAVLSFIKKSYKGKIITYIHELEFVAANNRSSVETITHTDHFLVPCEVVKKLLMNRYGVPASKISLLHYYLPDTKFSEQGNFAFARRYSISAPFVIGMAGSLNWRKGYDLFLQVARIFYNKWPLANAQFVWVGADEANIETKEIAFDIDKMNLNDKVKVLPVLNDMSDFYDCISILLLTSREDTYPMVMLEAAAHQRATVCFENAGGANEFIEGGNGIAIKYGEIEEMASIIYDLLNHPDKATEMGKSAKRKVETHHTNGQLILDQLYGVLENL